MVVSGVVCALFIGELAVRLLEPEMPVRSEWPTAETDIKQKQVSALAEDIDLVLIGSSQTEAAVDPALLISLGAVDSAYNAALPFSSPISDRIWLQDIVLDTVSPSIVIVGIPAWPVHTTETGDPLRAGLSRAISTGSSTWIGTSVALERNKGVLADWDERRSRQNLTESALWTELGHLTGYYQRHGETLGGRFPPYGEPRMSPDNLAALGETLMLLEAEGITGVLMLEPGHYPADVPETDIATFIDSIRVLAREHDVPLWDTYSVDWDASYFADEAHFNREGTRAFTSLLAEYLRGGVES
jgi:hypothetical protein